jgi:hypothetical protein
VRYTKDGVACEVKARTAVLATPAPISRRIGVNLPADLREALSKIVGLQLQGVPVGRPREPMLALPPDGLARLEQALKTMNNTIGT